MVRMGRRRRTLELEGIRYLLTLMEDAVSKQAGRSATSHDVAVGHQSLKLLLAIADQIEDSLRDTLSDRHVWAIRWVRRTCARYENKLWQTTPQFLVPR
jgi:hypothetical protein